MSEEPLLYPVYTKRPGIIRSVQWDDEYGKVVTLEFRVRRFGIMRTYIAVHTYMDGVTARPGLAVRKGTVLGYRRQPADTTNVVNRKGKIVKPLIYKGKVR